MVRKTCIIVVCLMLSYSLTAQLFPKRHFRTEDGLVQKKVTALFEDSRGALWIGTMGGVTRFDGHNLFSWTVQDGLECNSVKAITGDSEGGVFVFSDTGITMIKNGIITILCSGRHGELHSAINDDYGYSYFLTATEFLELWIYDPKGGVRKFPFFESFGTHPLILWKNRNNHEALLRDSHGAFYLLKDGLLEPISGFDSRPWLNYPLVESKDLMNRFSKYFDNSSSAGFLPFTNPDIQTIFHPSVGWFSFAKANPSKLLLTRNHQAVTVNYPFSTINCLLLDRRMQVWIGTDNGLVVFHHLLFRNYIDRKLIPDVSAVVEGQKGQVLVGTIGNKMIELTKDSILPINVSQTFHDKDRGFDDSNFSHGGVQGFDGEFYINSTNGVLTYKNKELRRLEGLPTEQVYTSLLDTVNRRILFSSFKNGIFSWSKGKLLKEEFKCNSSDFDRIYSMEYDKNGSLYVGSDRSVAIVSPKHCNALKDTNGDSIRGAYAMVRDLKNNMWFGNDYGLFLFDGVKISRMNHDFLNHTIRALKIVNGDQMLIGTSKGVGVFFLDTFFAKREVEIKSYDFRNGYEGGEVNYAGFYQDREGIIWIAAALGVVRMDPAWIRIDTIPVATEISQFQVYSDESSWVALHSDPTGAFKLDHNHNQIRISFNSVNLKSPQRDFYQFRLVGLSDQWGFPTQEMFAVFNNLKPGGYKFEVKARNKDDLWMEQPASLIIDIQPAWYQTNWFKLFFLIIVFSIITSSTFLLTRYAQRQKLNRVKKDQELAELNLAAIRNQLEPHFVFNVLNSIGYAIRANETDMAYDHLTKFSSLIRKWLKSTGESMLTLEAELELVKEYLDLEKFRFEERLNYKIEVEEGVPLDFKIPRMILQIPVENAVKHGISGHPDGGSLLIKVDNLSNGIRILVRDNGIGRIAAAKRTSAGNQKGIKLLEKLLSHVRDFNLYDVNYQVIDLYDLLDNPVGTAVEIIFRFR
jgi:ligand-binding sensor domain-containing protein